MSLGILFLIVAIIYSSVGFGGGSSYLALLLLWDSSFAIIPIIALICNIVVVSGNSFHYIRAGYLNLRIFLPLTLASLPMAYLGGRIEISKDIFEIILFVALLITGLRLLINHKTYNDIDNYTSISAMKSLVIGGALGFLAGIVGIGGGIFLAPILYNMRVASPRVIATTASLFILVNSIAGIVGQFNKLEWHLPDELLNYWHLPILVLIGGQIGNLLTIKILPPRIIALSTAILVLFVSIKLFLNI